MTTMAHHSSHLHPTESPTAVELALRYANDGVLSTYFILKESHRSGISSIKAQQTGVGV